MSSARLIHTILALMAPLIAHGYVYQAIPMFEQGGKIHCDKHTNIGKAQCKYHNNAIGMVCEVMKADLYVVNPYAQRCGINGSICGEEHDRKYGKCADYSGCMTMSDKNRACVCMPGFFGNPYEKCYKHCETDLDCPSPYAECRKDGKETMKRCKCKVGCPGDGVICKPDNICKDPKGNVDEHRRCLQVGVKDKSYICDAGYYLDTTTNKCKQAVALVGEMHVSVVANKFENGSRIDIGKCFSMVINNDKGESHFYQLNGGDAVVIKKKLVTDPQLYLAFEVKNNDIVAFGLLEEDKSKLTKLFTVSNGLGGCVVDSVEKYGPTGTRHAVSYVNVEVRSESEASEMRNEL